MAVSVRATPTPRQGDRDKRPLQRFVDESKRLLGELETRLDGRAWIMDDYSISHVATLGWERPAVQRGLEIPER